MQIKKKFVKILYVFAILIFIFIIIIACFMFILAFSFISNDDVYRELSPSGDIEIVIVEGNSGAISSFWYNLYIVKIGHDINIFDKSVAYYYGAMKSECSYGINVKWYNENTIIINYYKADIFQNENFFTINNKIINIISNDGIIDKQAPPGGMLYNIENEDSIEQRRLLYCK